jgi:hypothetical protein
MMNHPDSFLDEQDEIVNDRLMTAPGEPPCQDEALENMWSLSMTSGRARTTSVAAIVAFLDAVLHNRDRQLRAMHGDTYPMLFYCWVDEQAGQLRFSLIGGNHPRPPFGCELRLVESRASIAEQFLGLSTLDGIPWEELTEVTPDVSVSDEPPYVLDIWTQQLPLVSPT